MSLSVVRLNQFYGKAGAETSHEMKVQYGEHVSRVIVNHFTGERDSGKGLGYINLNGLELDLNYSQGTIASAQELIKNIEMILGSQVGHFLETSTIQLLLMIVNSKKNEIKKLGNEYDAYYAMDREDFLRQTNCVSILEDMQKDPYSLEMLQIATTRLNELKRQEIYNTNLKALKTIGFDVLDEVEGKSILASEAYIIVLEQGQSPNIYTPDGSKTGSTHYIKIENIEDGSLKIYGQDGRYTVYEPNGIPGLREGGIDENQGIQSGESSIAIDVAELEANGFTKIKDLAGKISLYQRVIQEDLDYETERYNKYLEKIGIEQMEKADWSCPQKETLKKSTIEAIVVNGKLFSVVNPLHKSINELLGKETTIVGKSEEREMNAMPISSADANKFIDLSLKDGSGPVEESDMLTVYYYAGQKLEEWNDKSGRFYFLEVPISYPTIKLLSPPYGCFELSTETPGLIVKNSMVLQTETPLSRALLGINEVKSEKVKGGFVLNGRNTSEKIKALKQIGNNTISELEKILREGYSMGGPSNFLDEGDNLIDILLQYNDYVLNLGLTHQQIAEPMTYVDALYNKTNLGYGQSHKEFRHENGQLYYIDVTQFKSSGQEYTLTRNDGEKLSFHSEEIKLIQELGFYGRKNPKDIIDFFNIENGGLMDKNGGGN